MTKYIGMDVHQATFSAAVVDSTGQLVMKSILESWPILCGPAFIHRTTKETTAYEL